MIKVLFRIPHTARLSIANLVILSDSIKIVFDILVTSLVITSLVASGVTSRGERPFYFTHFEITKKNFNSFITGTCASCGKY